MKDLILGLAIACFVVFGFYLMKRLDRFLKHNYKSRRIEPDMNGSGIMIFSRPDTCSKKEQDKGKAEEETPKETEPGEPKERAPEEYHHAQK